MPRILSRYIFYELGAIFALSLLILTGTALLSKVMKIIEIILAKGLGPSFALSFVASALPSFLIYTIPISFLIAVLAGFARLSSDSELIAIKASGIGLFSLLRPVAVLGGLAYGLCLFIFIYAFPQANLNLKNIIFEAARINLASSLTEGVFYDRFKGAVIYINHISPGTDELQGVFISQDLRGDGADVFFSRTASFESSPETGSIYLKLNNGTLHRLSNDGTLYHTADFSAYTIEMASPATKAAGSASNRELGITGLVEKARGIKAGGGDPSPVVIDLHKRFALPASVFVFALIGVPLGIQKARSARLTGFSTSIAVALAYYIASTAFESLGETGRIGPISAAWGSDVIFLIAGAFMFYRAAREAPALRLDRLSGIARIRP